MQVLWRWLGMAARCGESLSRRSLNFLPLHWLSMVAVGYLVVVGWRETGYALKNDAAPRSTDVTSVLARPDLDRNFVAVDGTLVPEAVFERTKSSRTDGTIVEESYQLLCSRADRKALLVMRKGQASAGKEPYDTTVTGLLVPLDEEVGRHLAQAGGTIGGVAVDPKWMLEADRRPGSFPVWLATTLVAAAWLLAMLVAWQRRYVVFQPARAEPAPPRETTPTTGDVRASGRFAVAGHKPRRFLAIPVQFGRLRSGRIGLQAHVDASSYFLGVKTADREGLWTISLEPEVLAKAEVGQQYIGFQRRPALRFHHEDARGRRTTTVVSCATEAERRGLVQALAELVASPPPEPSA